MTDSASSDDNNTLLEVDAMCAANEVAIGGGFTVDTDGNAPDPAILASRPVPPNQGATPTGWFASAETTNSADTFTLTAYAICASAAP